MVLDIRILVTLGVWESVYVYVYVYEAGDGGG